MPIFFSGSLFLQPPAAFQACLLAEVRVPGSLSPGRRQHRSHTTLVAPAAALAVTFPFITTVRETHCTAFKGNFTSVCTNIYPTCFLPEPALGPEDAVGHRQQGRGSSGEPASSHTKTFGLQRCAVCSRPCFSLMRFHEHLAMEVISGVASQHL